MIYSHPFSNSKIRNERTKGLLSKGFYEVKLISSSASVSVVFRRIKIFCRNSFMIVDFWIDFFIWFIWLWQKYKYYLVVSMFSDVNCANLKKSHEAIILNIFDDYAAVWSSVEYTSHLIHFCYSILQLSHKKTNSTIKRLYKVVPNIRCI